MDYLKDVLVNSSCHLDADAFNQLYKYWSLYTESIEVYMRTNTDESKSNYLGHWRALNRLLFDLIRAETLDESSISSLSHYGVCDKQLIKLWMIDKYRSVCCSVCYNQSEFHPCKCISIAQTNVKGVHGCRYCGCVGCN